MPRFRFAADIEGKGQYDTIDDEILVNLSKHASLIDLIDTIEHEYIHYLLIDENMSDLKEHRIITRLKWFGEDLI
uniref:Uncharacterized protein n=1 Tax=Nitrosopumivirus cobalaminus TaxID=3158414 RepID=A0AAU7N477_9VIRU